MKRSFPLLRNDPALCSCSMIFRSICLLNLKQTKINYTLAFTKNVKGKRKRSDKPFCFKKGEEGERIGTLNNWIARGGGEKQYSPRGYIIKKGCTKKSNTTTTHVHI